MGQAVITGKRHAVLWQALTDAYLRLGFDVIDDDGEMTFAELDAAAHAVANALRAKGVGKLADKNDMTVEESSELKKAILQLYPGLKQMYQDMKLRARNKEPIRTWGGREYYCEEPKLVDGRIREFDYKLVNVLIQGSAADCTKTALIEYHAAKHPNAKIVLNVHDQITVSVPKKIMKTEMEVLRKTMEGVAFDVPILSEGAISSTNWDELQDYDKKGKVL